MPTMATWSRIPFDAMSVPSVDAGGNWRPGGRAFQK